LGIISPVKSQAFHYLNGQIPYGDQQGIFSVRQGISGNAVHPRSRPELQTALCVQTPLGVIFQHGGQVPDTASATHSTEY
jgi:hypothetical protein